MRIFTKISERSCWNLCYQLRRNIPHPSIVSAVATYYRHHSWWGKSTQSRNAVAHFQCCNILTRWNRYGKHSQNRRRSFRTAVFGTLKLRATLLAVYNAINNCAMHFHNKFNNNIWSLWSQSIICVSNFFLFYQIMYS